MTHLFYLPTAVRRRAVESSDKSHMVGAGTGWWGRGLDGGDGDWLVWTKTVTIRAIIVSKYWEKKVQDNSHQFLAPMVTGLLYAAVQS